MADQNIYKNTLNLPQTDFPMKANLAAREPTRLKIWQAEKIYEKMLKARQNNPTFVLHDGPPYANGAIHIGHTVNKILKDIILKFKHLCGFKTEFIPGWDCHGLPIELNIEKKYGKAAKIGTRQFRNHCRTYAGSQIKQQKADFMRLGVFADWENHYDTKAFKSEAEILRSLGKIIQTGHVAQGFRPVYWCLDCASALAEAEIEYHPKKSCAVDVAFKIDPSQPLSGALSVLAVHQAQFIIWTTTPWTLPANQAVAVSSEVEYTCLRIKQGEGSRYIVIAKALQKEVLARYQVEDYELIETFVGEQLCNLMLIHPLDHRLVSVVHSDHVTLETGTGLVHIAPSCGAEDFDVGVKYKLPMDVYVDYRGCYTDFATTMGGAHIKKADNIVLDQLKAQNTLVHFESYQHSYPHCWRHKTPIIFRLTHQWFVGMGEQLLAQASQASDQVSWLPSWGKDRLKSMLDNRPDWCISRQRYWGVPIAVFVHQKTHQLHPDTLQIIEQVAAAIEKEGIDVWFDDPMRFLPTKDHKTYQAGTDVLDVWFDSGVTHQFVLSNRLGQSEADVYLEGKDQYRGWFQSSLLTAIATGQKKAPYKQVITHGFVVDQKGRKMSKSLGNVVSPQQVTDTLGADILRLWVATNDYTQELTISDEILRHTVDHYRRIRNTFKFLLGNLGDFNPKTDEVEFEHMVRLDQWLLDEVKKLQQAVYADYSAYRFHLGVQKITLFCTEKLGGFYLDVLKDRLYTTAQKSAARRSAQSALFHLCESMLRQLMPILPFTTDEVSSFAHWRTDCVFLSDRYEALNDCVCDAKFSLAVSQIQRLKQAIEKVLDDFRKQGKIGHSLKATVNLFVDEDWADTLDQFGDELHFILMVSKVVAHPIDQQSGDSTYTVDEGLLFSIQALNNPRCARCWHCTSSVGKHSAHVDLCTRCITNITTNAGETRSFV